MISFSGGDVKVVLLQSALDSIVHEVGKQRYLETGGILIGKYSEDLRAAYIEEATGPGIHSLHFPFRFKRGSKDLQKLLDKAACKGLFYLGEWHSHPGRSCLPSTQDYCQMRSISEQKSYMCPEPILLIVGSSDPLNCVSVSVIFSKSVIALKREDF